MQDTAAVVIENCHACGSAMDVTDVGPFTNVECPACGAHNRVKQDFGPYVLHRRHSLGGMSAVFVALDRTLNREVALKILNEQWCADERRISAFVDEARLTASFTHPNVVRVFRTGWAFGRFYIAMELVPGDHLEHWIREKVRIPEDEVLRMAIQVAHGLKAAQAAGLIHRDMKPGNILLDEHGSAKIVDFGLALVTQGGSAQAKELWATPYYVPPEAVDGKPETFRADMYAFGATLYHALAGVPPCAEDSMATDKLREAKKNVKQLQRECPDISIATCKVVNRAMAYEPEDRFSSYDEMIRLLEDARRELKSGGTIQTRKKGFPLAMVSAAVILLILAGGGGWWWLRSQQPVKKAADPMVSTPVAAPPDASNGNPKSSSDVARRYQEAKVALETGDDEKAGNLFAALRDDEGVQEPTASWAGVEAAIAAASNGDYRLASKRAKETVDHVKNRKVKEPVMVDQVMPLLTNFSGLTPVASGKLSTPVVDHGQVLLAMLAGLKNWEQGAIQEALPFFRAIADANLSADLKVYQQRAQNYLKDYTLLADPVFENYPKTSLECRQAVEMLEGFLPRLHTKGRARFNIRAWQLDLAKQAKRLKAEEAKATQAPQQAPPVADSPDAVLEKITALARQYDFAGAESYLKNRGGNTPLAQALAVAVEDAWQLTRKLTGDLRQHPAALGLTLRSGARIEKLTADGEGALTGTGSAGRSVRVTWEDLTPEAIIALHRNSVKSLSDDAEITRRHEQAIYFDWLAGNRTRSYSTADRFSESNPQFRERWQAFLGKLPQ